MTGVPSIVAGLFIYTALRPDARASSGRGFAGALALTILMLPVMVRSTEEMLKLVPNELREASYALGVPKWRTILRVVLPTALPGIITGAMLAVARVAGRDRAAAAHDVPVAVDQLEPVRRPAGVAARRSSGTRSARGTDASVDRAWAGALT